MEANKHSEAVVIATGEKLKNPHNEVLCPKCGGRLMYYRAASGAMVWCDNERCNVKRTVRGI